MEEKRLAVIAIVVENMGSVSKLNEILHQFGNYIIGRMGIPCRDRNVCLISIGIDAPNDVISSMTGKIGKLDGVSVKAAYSRV